MCKRRILLSFLIITFGLMTSCNQTKEIKDQEEAEFKPMMNYKDAHSYGGWFCPDNFGGFPPVDIQELDAVPVVNDRLPTLEESRNGTSLMYFEEGQVPDARPVEMTLPKLARHYSHHNGINEIVIVIQAVVIGKDTVVGFRYPSGGNGSSWYDEVTFLTDEEVAAAGPTPYVYLRAEIDGSIKDIWNAVIQTSYADKMGRRFDKKEFFSSEWTPESKARLEYHTEDERAAGYITNMYGNFYMHIDYDKKDAHFSEKMLVSGKSDEKSGELHIVSGPYPEDVEKQRAIWQKWIDEVKELSEKK